MALTETQASISGDNSLHVDHFGLSIGSVSVGLPLAGTADDVYRRYLDLLRLRQGGPVVAIAAPAADLEALAAATKTSADFVACRLAALQAS